MTVSDLSAVIIARVIKTPLFTLCIHNDTNSTFSGTYAKISPLGDHLGPHCANLLEALYSPPLSLILLFIHEDVEVGTFHVASDSFHGTAISMVSETYPSLQRKIISADNICVKDIIYWILNFMSINLASGTMPTIPTFNSCSFA